MLACLAPSPGYVAELVAQLHVENPRSFGHFLGDVVARRVEFSLLRPDALAQDKLPAASRVSGYLELTQVVVHSTESAQSTHYAVDFIYQIINSPVQPQVIFIPAMTLRVGGGGRWADAQVDEWPLSVAPVSAGGIRDGMPSMRPARPPQLIATEAARRRLLASAALALVLLGYLAWQRWGSRRRVSQRPFAAAHREVRTLAKQPFTIERQHAALRALHRAFDNAMGVRVFAEQLDDFIDRCPHFAEVRIAAVGFFDASRSVFFGDTGRVTDIATVLEWSAAFKACESRAAAVLATSTAEASHAAAG